MMRLVQRDDASAYVLGALDPGEREAFERLTRRDPAAAAEVAEFTRVAAMLAYAAPAVALPQDLRAKVLGSAEGGD